MNMGMIVEFNPPPKGKSFERKTFLRRDKLQPVYNYEKVMNLTRK